MEPILKQDGEQKNDCERNAAKWLCAGLKQNHPTLDVLLVEDALYANAPHLRQITGYGWKYVLNVKPDSHASLFKQFAGRKARGDIKELRQTYDKGVEHYYAWTTHLTLFYLMETGNDEEKSGNGIEYVSEYVSKAKRAHRLRP